MPFRSPSQRLPLHSSSRRIDEERKVEVHNQSRIVTPYFWRRSGLLVLGDVRPAIAWLTSSGLASSGPRRRRAPTGGRMGKMSQVVEILRPVSCGGRDRSIDQLRTRYGRGGRRRHSMQYECYLAFYTDQIQRGWRTEADMNGTASEAPRDAAGRLGPVIAKSRTESPTR